MGTEDHLDNEVAVAAQLTETGIVAKAKSRTISAIDRLGGNLAELMNTKVERRTSRERAIINGEKELMEAVVKSAVERIGVDPAFADRALRTHFQSVLQQQENKDGVIQVALEDLRNEPPSSAEADAGPEELSTEFQTRFGEYAKEASTEELQARWGRVLAAEIRVPGTFSQKVLRTVDELDPVAALLFEDFCKHRIGSVVPLALSGKMPFDQISTLVQAGLIVNPGTTGHNVSLKKDKLGEKEMQLLPLGTYIIAFPADVDVIGLSSRPDSLPLRRQESSIVLPVYILTPEAQSISKILPDDSRDAILALQVKIQNALPAGARSIRLKHLPDTNKWWRIDRSPIHRLRQHLAQPLP